MSDIDELVKRAMELKAKGLTQNEIAAEMHLDYHTITWLQTRGVGKEETAPTADVKIGWRTIGVTGRRIRHIAEIMSDIVLEEIERREMAPTTVMGIAHNGIPFGTQLAEILDVEFALMRPSADRKAEGTISSNFAGLEGKEVIIVDDVVGSGDTIRSAARDIRSMGGKPVLALCIVNKTGVDELDGVPLRALVRARVVG